jgi:hypothetical protein
MKQRFTGSKVNQLSNPQSNRVVRIFRAWFAVKAPHHHVEALMSLALIPIEPSGQFYLQVQQDQARRMREWPPPGDANPEAPRPLEARWSCATQIR